MLLYIIMGTKKENNFDKFWELYPRKVSKFVAKRFFSRLSNKDQVNILKTLPEHLKRWDNKELQYIPHAKTWLHERRWEDELEPLENARLVEDKLEIARLKFEKQMKEAEGNIATDEEKRNILLKR